MLFIIVILLEFLQFQMTEGIQASAINNTRRQNIKIYVKLSTVMGVTWLLGFGAPHNTIVAYVYIIVNSLQGMKLSEKKLHFV